LKKRDIIAVLPEKSHFFLNLKRKSDCNLPNLGFYKMSGTGALFFGLMNAISGWERPEVLFMLLTLRMRSIMRTAFFLTFQRRISS
jgi:hypothetical protein